MKIEELRKKEFMGSRSLSEHWQALLDVAEAASNIDSVVSCQDDYIRLAQALIKLEAIE